MQDFSHLTICLKEQGNREEAINLSNKIHLPISSELGEELTVLFDENGVSLCGYGLSYQGDFTSLLKRVTKQRISSELLVHTAKGKNVQSIVDATAGAGEDSFLLAASGCRVRMIEHNPVIATLLKDSLERAKSNDELVEIVSRMELIEGDSVDVLPTLENVDVVYIDAMFPTRQKSSLVNKRLQLFQHLELPSTSEEELFLSARKANPQKIIIKRPLKGPYFANIKPHYSTKGKVIRYDCFTFPKEK